MRLASEQIIHLDEIDSTQEEAARRIATGTGLPGAIVARHQTAGRGRFDRQWLDEPDASLCVSLLLPDYRNHSQPWLIGMSIAVAVASSLHAQLRWPNDVTVGGRKLAGVLTEIKHGVPVVGVGVNLNQAEFPPDLRETATSILLSRGHQVDPEIALAGVMAAILDMPEPDSWDVLKPIWSLFDATPGKAYRLADGQESVAIGIGPGGELITSVEGETTSVLAADALFGPTRS